MVGYSVVGVVFVVSCLGGVGGWVQLWCLGVQLWAIVRV